METYTDPATGRQLPADPSVPLGPADGLSRRQIIARLKANTERRAKNASEADRLLEQREELYFAARDPEVGITVREIAEIAGLTEVAINKEVAKIRARKAKALWLAANRPTSQAKLTEIGAAVGLNPDRMVALAKEWAAA